MTDRDRLDHWSAREFPRGERLRTPAAMGRDLPPARDVDVITDATDG